MTRWPQTTLPAMKAALQRRGARAFYQSRLRAELGNVGATSLFPLRQWLVTLDMWHGQRLVHSSAHEAEKLFGIYRSADDLLVPGFNFDLRSQPMTWKGNRKPVPAALKWDIAVSVVRKDDGAIAPLVRRVNVGDVFSGYRMGDFPCSMPVENIITKHRPFGDVNFFLHNLPYVLETYLHIVEDNNSSHAVVSSTDLGMELNFLLLSFELCKLGYAEDNSMNYDPYIDLKSAHVQEILHAHLIFDVKN